MRRHLDRLYCDSQWEGAVWILQELRSRGSIQAAEPGFWANLNLRQPLLRLIEKAGIPPWPRLFHNLRSSAQTDLANRFPIHGVCEWLGNTATIAAQHYLQVTEEHAAEATASHGVAQNPARTVPESTRIASHGVPRNAKTPVNTGVSGKQVAGAGFEPTTSRL